LHIDGLSTDFICLVHNMLEVADIFFDSSQARL
jgi:hypothetical protein